MNRLFVLGFDKLSGVWSRTLSSGLRRASLIAALTLPVAATLLYPPFRNAASTAVTPPKATSA